MPKRGQQDHSPGDHRQPYSDEGGPEGHHATTHDVGQERSTRPTGGHDAGEDFTEDMAPLDVPGAPSHRPGHADESTSAAEMKELHGLGLRADELTQLQVLDPGTRLEEGGVYLDLNDLDAGEFTAMGGQEAVAGRRYIAKRDTDHELWNRIIGRERPNGAATVSAGAGTDEGPSSRARGSQDDQRSGERGAAAHAGIVDQQDAALSEMSGGGAEDGDSTSR